MSINVRLDAFEGPLDLLLHLIEKNRVDICDIPIAAITDQYMEYMLQIDTADMDTASEFLVMAATLLDIKARMLLPPEEDGQGEPEDPRAELVERLIAYRLMKADAGLLRESRVTAENILFKGPTIPAEVAEWVPPVDLEEMFADRDARMLARAFASALRRREEKEDPVRAGFGHIKRETYRIYDKSMMILRLAGSKRHFSFDELLDAGTGRVEMIVTFLAVLELVRMGRLGVRQEGIGGSISLEAVNTEEMSGEELELLTENADE